MNFLFKIIIIKSFFTILILNNNLLAQNTKIIAKVGGEIVTSFELENKIEGSNNIENSANYLSNHLLSIGSNELIEDVPPS